LVEKRNAHASWLRHSIHDGSVDITASQIQHWADIKKELDTSNVNDENTITPAKTNTPHRLPFSELPSLERALRSTSTRNMRTL
jgi:hypothetical protein